ncbi:hypothetical protein O9K51_09614 [Purpureocillium lavendulum]|uniref:Uncharacterized protein n=1 Tax=Purpureocillium lavendulum TaxID=1247861 RepID=A0AB34FH94_9HYPO|nr:hypothetical protein O9K51_09614 [Purpureocillium lavendulum]
MRPMNINLAVLAASMLWTTPAVASGLESRAWPPLNEVWKTYDNEVDAKIAANDQNLGNKIQGVRAPEVPT